MTKNLTLIFNKDFEEIHLGKDVFLVPYYLGKLLKYNVTIVYRSTSKNRNIPQIYNGVRLIPLDYIYKQKAHYLYNEREFLLYIMKNAKKIDLLMCFHHNFQTELTGLIYKFLNPKGKIYLKMDVNPEMIEYNKKNNFINNIIHNKLTKIFIKKTTIASCETKLAYESIKKSQLKKNKWDNKLELINNGFDENYLSKLNIKERNFEEKDNIFITVGRIGSYEKNSDFILQSLAKVDLKKWKFYFIGPIDDNFKKTIDLFFKNNQDKIDNIIFMGPIYDKKELWEFYNKAKVFVFASRWESYGLVFNEAKRFRNFIVSTPVGAFYDITENEKYGISFKQNSIDEFTLIINNIIEEKININVYQNFNPYELSWEYNLSKITSKLT